MSACVGFASVLRSIFVYVNVFEVGGQQSALGFRN